MIQVNINGDVKVIYSINETDMKKELKKLFEPYRFRKFIYRTKLFKHSEPHERKFIKGHGNILEYIKNN